MSFPTDDLGNSILSPHHSERKGPEAGRPMQVGQDKPDSLFWLCLLLGVGWGVEGGVSSQPDVFQVLCPCAAVTHKGFLLELSLPQTQVPTNISDWSRLSFSLL